MALTVYCMGDMPIFTSVLNAVAMAFSSSLFDPSQGAGVVIAGLLIGIIFMILPATIAKGIDPKPFIFALFLFYGGVLPKERLQIEDVYTGTSTAVDNVPLIVALPASIVATLSKAMTDQVETSFSTTSGSYLAMGQEGFVNPLKLLLSLRNPPNNKRTFPYLSASLTEFVKYCAPTDPAFNVKTMSSNADIVGYLASLGNVHGVMTYYNSANPQGLGTACSDGITRISADVAALSASGDMNKLFKSQTAGEYANNPSAAGATFTGFENAYNSVTAGIVANGQDAQKFMVNMIAMTPVSQGVDCINQPTGPNMAECMTAVMTRETMERANVDSAAAASIFAKIAIPTMNVLLALFYAFSPIVIGMAFLSASHGIKIILGYLMFGAWTQSWMPIAAVLNYMIQMQTQYAISSFPTDGVTMENYMQFYNVVTMKVSTASELMAMTPMISMALLSGSMMALTSVSNKMGGKDYVDETNAAPKSLDNGSITSNGSQLVRNATAETGQADGRMAGSPLVQQTTAGRVDFATVDAADAADRKASHDRALAHSASQKKSAAQSRVSGIAKSVQDQEKVSRGGSAALANIQGTERNMIHEYVSAMAKDNNWNESEQKAVETQLVAAAKTGTPGEGVLGSGISLTASAGMKDTTVQQYMQSVKDSQSDTNKNSYAAKQAATKKLEQMKSHNIDFGQSLVKSDQMAEEFKSASEEATSAERKASESESVSRGMKTSKSMKSNEIAQQLVSRFGGARAALNNSDAAANAGLNKEAFNAQVAEKVKDLRKHGAVGSDDVLAVSAGLEILGASGSAGADQVLSMMQNGGMVAKGTSVGMNESDKGEFSSTGDAAHSDAQNAGNNVAGAHVAGQTAVKANKKGPRVLTESEKQSAKTTTSTKLAESVSPDIDRPDAKTEAAQQMVEEAGLNDEWTLYKKAALDAGLMIAGGMAGKYAGNFIARMRQAPIKSNPGMLGTDSKEIIEKMAQADAKAAAMAKEGMKDGVMAGVVVPTVAPNDAEPNKPGEE